MDEFILGGVKILSQYSAIVTVLIRVNALFHILYIMMHHIIEKQIEKKIYIYITLITPRQSAGKIDTTTHNLQWKPEYKYLHSTI